MRGKTLPHSWYVMPTKRGKQRIERVRFPVRPRPCALAGLYPAQQLVHHVVRDAQAPVLGLDEHVLDLKVIREIEVAADLNACQLCAAYDFARARVLCHHVRPEPLACACVSVCACARDCVWLTCMRMRVYMCTDMCVRKPANVYVADVHVLAVNVHVQVHDIAHATCGHAPEPGQTN